MNTSLLIRKLGTIGFLAFFITTASAQIADTVGLGAILKFRAARDAEFKDSAQSPLSPADRDSFKGLCYFDIDLAYRVNATFTQTETPTLFRIPTTTGRQQQEFRKYGELAFTLQGVSYRLAVYQSPRLMKVPGYENYLFVPFTDLTNGTDTYVVGRYIDFRIPQGNTVVLDFNQCYYPSCSYNTAYSCPIPPEENRLTITVPAGERNCVGGSGGH